MRFLTDFETCGIFFCDVCGEPLSATSDGPFLLSYDSFMEEYEICEGDPRTVQFVCLDCSEKEKARGRPEKPLPNDR